jgi:hypothetical protein
MGKRWGFQNTELRERALKRRDLGVFKKGHHSAASRTFEGHNWAVSGSTEKLKTGIYCHHWTKLLILGSCDR